MVGAAVKKAILISCGVLTLWFLSKSNYLLFHTIVEMFAVSVALNIFYIGISSQKICKNNFLTKISYLYLMVAFIDLVHTLAYKGMGVFKDWSADQPTQLWILGRVTETLGLSMAVLFPKLRKDLLAIVVFGLGSLGLMAVSFGFFPACFIEGQGLTAFKIATEYVLVVILLLTSIAVCKTRDSELLPVKKPIFAAFLLSAAAELSFTLYTDVYGFFNMLGHLIRFLSYYVILDGMIVKSFIEPTKILTYELEEEKHRYAELSQLDPLTGLYNRRYLNEWLNKYAETSTPRSQMNIVMMDLDHLKTINDRFGHLHGDEVLRFFAEILKQNTRASDFAVRYGGDEFLVVLSNTNSIGAREFVERVKKIVEEKNPFNHAVTFSYGIENLSKEYVQSLQRADELMYEMKRQRSIEQAGK